MSEPTHAQDRLFLEYEITLPPASGQSDIVFSVKPYIHWEQRGLVFVKRQDGQREKLVELGANRMPGHATLAHPDTPITLVVHIEYREGPDNSSLPWNDSALKVIYNGPEAEMSHGNPHYRDNRLIIGAEVRAIEKLREGQALNWCDLRMNITYNGSSPAEVRPVRHDKK